MCRAPAVSVVAGQSVRGRSSPRYADSPPLHSSRSGMRSRSRPSIRATRMLSHSRTAAPAAIAARQAGVSARPPSGPQAAARLNGLVGARARSPARR
ncbi:hypothetical protein B0E53_02090 [Micromonospora sp. MH33]|nr:hypothetical protein B0E53_02090 [Micromonospora sp. MH33]